ncbi:MAG: hypothetical protein H2038_09415 [Brevundimonas sp.]|uniref:hypothetical protein n=1 Tax=Brevundimonas sp. TaxID=1871086 RepID=UPI0017FC1D62|nr:hypothetical protein [Brevundimonas sp.]MBA4804854.1 hypothetical protein [Brevundimonas sp.]
MKRLVIALAALLAAACQPMPGTPGAPGQEAPAVDEIDTTDVPPAVRVPERTEASDCEARGGRMTPQGRMQTLQCVVSYADAGKRCTDGDDCQGDCRVEDAPFPAAGASAVGRCQADSGRFGCYATVENGRAQAALCVD